MRRDLVEEALDDIAEELFEDVVYTHAPAGPVTVSKAIFGVEIVADRFETYGQSVRTETHITRALKAKFPTLTVGDLLNDGTEYRVVDVQPAGDGRLEIEIGLVAT